MVFNSECVPRIISNLLLLYWAFNLELGTWTIRNGSPPKTWVFSTSVSTTRGLGITRAFVVVHIVHVMVIVVATLSFYEPGVTLPLPSWGCKSPLAAKSKVGPESVQCARVRPVVSDTVSMMSRGWDIGPANRSGSSPWPSWNARTHGHLHKGRPLYTYIHCHFLEDFYRK